ncbi:MAG: hypothetical protein AAF587_44010 [Bacteroidota bacterium]
MMAEENQETRSRKADGERKPLTRQPRGHKTICIPVGESEYKEIVDEAWLYRKWVDDIYGKHPELFPQEMDGGYKLHDKLPESKKLPEIRLRRIKLSANDEVYTIRPSCVLPYMAGYTDDVENGLLLLNFGIPYWLVTHVCGKDDMYWQRLEVSFGRNSLVGTTVRTADKLPKDLVPDEKHTTINGEKTYIATTVGDECVLGAAMSPSAGEKDLTQAYGQFKSEALNVDSAYQPDSVNTDGWTATINTWLALFPSVAMILCFLHSFIKIRSCGKRLGHTYFELCTKVWEVYHCATEDEFHPKMADLAIWALEHLPDGPALEAVIKLCLKYESFAEAYSHPSAHRTSNMVDRHMGAMDRYLFAGHFFHGHLMSAEYRILAWALIRNFRPFCPRAQPHKDNFQSRAHRLNGFVYHHNWLHNLLISSSMAGFRP